MELAVNNDHSHAELFDLVQDPWKKKYFAEYPKIVAALKNMLGEAKHLLENQRVRYFPSSWAINILTSEFDKSSFVLTRKESPGAKVAM